VPRLEKGRVLVLGGQGMLGHVVVDRLRDSGMADVVWTTRGAGEGALRFNVLDGPARLRQVIEQAGPPRWIVNCIAVLQSQIDERNPDSVRLAERINTEFPLHLATIAAEVGASILHISTDAVFPPGAGRCAERTPPGPANVYARTKLHGEIVADNVLNLRCSIVGPDPWHRRGLIEWLRSRPAGSRVPGFTNQQWVGATTYQVAELCRVLITEGFFEEAVREGPVHHFCPCEPVSKYELLRQAVMALHADVEVLPTVSEQQVTRQLDTNYRAITARFPKYGRLDAALAALTPRPREQAA